MIDFQVGQRVRVTASPALARRLGEPGARWLDGRLGVIHTLARAEAGAFVRVDDRLPRGLASHPPDHPLGRNVLLFPWDCELVEARTYAPFHRVEFEDVLGRAAGDIDREFCSSSGSSWWMDATQALHETSSTGLWERVYRLGVAKERVSLLVYSSIDVRSGWSRPASEDAVRFVHERRWPAPAVFLDTERKVYRSGSDPLERVRARVAELLSPAVVEQAASRIWTPERWVRRKTGTNRRRVAEGPGA